MFSVSCISNMAISSSEAKCTLFGIRGLISGSSSETEQRKKELLLRRYNYLQIYT